MVSKPWEVWFLYLVPQPPQSTGWPGGALLGYTSFKSPRKKASYLYKILEKLRLWNKDMRVLRPDFANLLCGGVVNT